jgi:hypothetical protein
MDELFKNEKFKIFSLPFQKQDSLLDVSHLKNGIIPPRNLVLEFVGNFENLSEEFSKLSGFSVEGIVGIPLGELKEIKMKANSLEKLKEMVEEKNWKKHDLKFRILIQLYGQIAIPMNNLQSFFEGKVLKSKM